MTAESETAGSETAERETAGSETAESETAGDVARLTAGALHCSIANNNLTNGGRDMSGVKAIAAALPNTQISDLK